MRDRLEAYVVSQDGATVRGSLLTIGQYGVNANFNTANRNKSRASSGTAISSVSAQDGDRIVVRYGYSDSAGITPSATTNYGDILSGSVPDLPEDEIATNGVAWVEFSATLAFRQVTFSLKEDKIGTGNTSSVTTSSFTATVNTPQLLIAQSSGAGARNTPTITSAPTGLTFQQVADVTLANGGTNDRITVFIATYGSAAAGTITADYGGQNQTALSLAWIELLGAAPGTNGTECLRQVKTGTSTSGSTLTITPNATVLPDSSLLFSSINIGSAVTHTVRTGWGVVTTGGTNSFCRGTDVRCNADTAGSTVWSAGSILLGFLLEIIPVPAQGSAAVTLGAVTSSATGTVGVAGTAVPTLGAVTLSAAGSVDQGGVLAATLGAVTSTASGAVVVTGTLAQTLGAMTLSAAVASANGALAQTLGAMTLNATGTASSVKVGMAGLRAGATLRILGNPRATSSLISWCRQAR